MPYKDRNQQAAYRKKYVEEHRAEINAYNRKYYGAYRQEKSIIKWWDDFRDKFDVEQIDGRLRFTLK